jgi:hypothetical protein
MDDDLFQVLDEAFNLLLTFVTVGNQRSFLALLAEILVRSGGTKRVVSQPSADEQPARDKQRWDSDAMNHPVTNTGYDIRKWTFTSCAGHGYCLLKLNTILIYDIAALGHLWGSAVKALRIISKMMAASHITQLSFWG